MMTACAAAFWAPCVCTTKEVGGIQCINFSILVSFVNHKLILSIGGFFSCKRDCVEFQGLCIFVSVSSRSLQWPRLNQTKFLSQLTSLSTHLHHKRSKKTLHAPKAQSCDSDEANISENLAILEELNDGGELELFSEKSTTEADGLSELKKGGRSRRRNDSFVDEAARLAEIDAHLFCGNVRVLK